MRLYTEKDKRKYKMKQFSIDIIYILFILELIPYKISLWKNMSIGVPDTKISPKGMGKMYEE